MKIYVIGTIVLIFCLFLIVVNSEDALGQSVFQVQSTNLTLYRDGLVHCEQELVLESSILEVTLPLLSESPQNILLLDENKTAVDYKVTGNNLTTYCLGARNISIEYDTLMLTSKEAEIWTLMTNCQYDLTVFLPQNSSVVYLSSIPLAIQTKESAITLSLNPGNWEIDYILSVIPPDDVIDNSDNSNQQIADFSFVYLGAVVSAIAVVVLTVVLYKKKKEPNTKKILKANPQLGKEDKDVIQFLVEKGGNAFEAELREKFPYMPRTSLWRLVRRLERLEIVEVKKVGLENQVIIKK